ncbi:VWFA-related Acidobacterial domain protein [Salinivirga cyanobacteriivorans]|uniref:VWFA-related Acidobacterial domain protein n=1 Tax=Salinivirga cyanobacteriivorans TaxID=1307839 RepID=A0A0S2I2R4_9BACT|nr:VWA domain-containing protein [Salinivirga cyanobacteriivorans]ALO16491.1 VWFA-related Acidobacterial domain protein [Salinivirga cyanobacteriivorans]
MSLNGYTFANPEYLYLLLLLIPMAVWYIFRHKKQNASIRVSSLGAFKQPYNRVKEWARHSLPVLRLITVVAVILVIARPQSTNNWEKQTTEGIDIVMALDVSSSMLARDLRPDRLDAAKDVATQFINGRPNDRIGLTIFSGQAFTQCPLTTDHATLLNLFKDVKSGMIEDGTAIGLGLATSINRLRESNADSKVIILLTDGVNNRGEIDPVTAAELANTFGIRVYTIGVGSRGTAPYPVQTPFGTQYKQMEVEIDEATLQEMAQMTDGKYFRATSNSALKQIYDQIDQMEKTRIETKSFAKKQEEYIWFAIIAAIALLTEAVLRATIFRTMP